MEPHELIRTKKGIIATVCLSGLVNDKYAIQFSNLRSYNDRNDLHAIEYRIEHATLVEQGRDNIVAHALKEGYDWLMMIDADAAPIPRDITERFLNHLFVTSPYLDLIGAYAQLRSPPHRPTIDTGTGTWEDIHPGRGLLRVIRTGAHCFMANTRAYQRVPAPWYKTRQAIHPARALMEVDNFCRTHMDGTNPLTDHPEWITMLHEVADQPPVSDVTVGVGEDSAFCDRLVAAGGVVVVDTDTVVGHVDQKVIVPKDHYNAIHDMRRKQSLVLGVER